MTKNRYFQLILGTAALLLLGVAYAWSLFVSPLEAEFGWNRSETSLTFTLSMICFSSGGIVGGILDKHLSCKKIFQIAAGLIAAGFFLCAGVERLVHIYLAYGVFVGLGIGISYNVIITVVNGYFPDKPGFSSGVLLMGYGTGSFLLSAFIEKMTGSFGWRTAFFMLAAAFGVVMLVLSAVMRRNPVMRSLEMADGGVDVATDQMLRMPSFQIYFCWGTMMSAIGLSIIGHSALIASAMGASTAGILLAAGCVAVSNGVSRVLFGRILDRKGQKTTIHMIAVCVLAGLILLIAASELGWKGGLYLALCCTAGAYGGATLCHASVIKKSYGEKYYGGNFGVITTSGIPAAFLGPYMTGVLQNLTSSYLPAFFMLLLYACVAFCLQNKFNQ